MNKQDLIDEWGRRTNAESKAAARRGVEAFINIITATVATGEEVRIGGLGIFERVYRKSRAARDPNTGAPVEVAGRWAVRFRSATKLKAAVTK